MIHFGNSIALRAALFVGALSTVMLLCAALLMIRLGGDDDGTWGAYDVADQIKVAVIREANGKLAVRPTEALKKTAEEFPAFWYIVSDSAGWTSFGPVPEKRLKVFTESYTVPGHENGSNFIAYSVDGETKQLKRLATQRDTAVGPISIETGGVAYSAAQMTWGTITDAAFMSVPILIVLGVTALVGLIVVPPLITRPVNRTASAVEMIDGTREGARVPEDAAPHELLPVVRSFNKALDRIDSVTAAQRQFLSNAAHELRTPLTKIRLQLDDIADGALRGNLISDVQQLSSTVTMLLQLARMSSEGPQLTTVDLVEIARMATAEHVPTALHKGAEILFAAPDHPLMVNGSAQAINIAVSNLIRNAVLHSQTLLPVVVQVHDPATIAVIDFGVGIAEQYRGLALKPLTRGHVGSDGTGLGLSIVAQVMALHGGGVVIDDTPGGGVTISLNFAVAAAKRRV